jgi:RNA 3'-terminal phosphate cyclase (ATP)
MSWPEECASVAEVKSQGPGNAVVIEVESEHITEVFTAFGQRGVRAEQVAKDVAAQARDYLDAGVPVGRHLADQLLIPMALAGGGAFRTVAPTRHTRTNCDILKHFLDVSVSMEQEREDRWRVEIGA